MRTKCENLCDKHARAYMAFIPVLLPYAQCMALSRKQYPTMLEKLSAWFRRKR